jgi:hypothetical protein
VDLLDYLAAQQARDEGLQRVTDHGEDYHARALALIPTLRSAIGDTFQGEDIRAALVERIGHPHSHKIWGAIIRTAVKREIIIGTGEYRACRSVRTHAHPTQVYAWP